MAFPTLNTNEIFNALYNMIISQQVFADNIKGAKSTLVDMARVDGTLYGDTKLYYSTDALYSSEWGNDAEAANLLTLYRPEAPECQAITIDKFRQIALTLDQYLTKRAFMNEGDFSSFNSVMLGWIRDTKKIYDTTTYNSYFGTVASAVGGQTRTVDITNATAGLTGEEAARAKAGVIGEDMANLIVDLKDTTRNYNDYGNIRAVDTDDLLFVWNSKYVSQIEKRDLPTTFHKDFIDKFAEHTLPARYFGTVNAASVTASNGTTIRSLVEQVVEDKDKVKYHLFAGDVIPANVTLAASGAIKYPSYTVDDKIIYKVVHKDSIPYMSAFEVGTSFFNPKSLTETHYLTWGHNTLQYLKNYPMITVKEV